MPIQGTARGSVAELYHNPRRIIALRPQGAMTGDPSARQFGSWRPIRQLASVRGIFWLAAGWLTSTLVGGF